MAQDMRVQDTKDQAIVDHDTTLSPAVVQPETPTHCPTPALSRLLAVTAQPNSHRLVPRQIPRCLGCLRRNIVFRIRQFPPITTHRRNHRSPPPEHSRKCLPCGCLYQHREHHLMSPPLTLPLGLRDVVPRCLLPILLPRAADGLLTTLDRPLGHLCRALQLLDEPTKT